MEFTLMHVMMTIVVAFFVTIIVNILIVSSLYKWLRAIFETSKSVERDVNNMIDGSKRIERNVDAINQRTRAHMQSPKSSSKKSPSGITIPSKGGKKRSSSQRGSRYEKKPARTFSDDSRGIKL